MLQYTDKIEVRKRTLDNMKIVTFSTSMNNTNYSILMH